MVDNKTTSEQIRQEVTADGLWSPINKKTVQGRNTETEQPITAVSGEKPRNQGAPYRSEPKLTRKQKAFADELLQNPKRSATQAVMNTYDVQKRRTAEVIASENLRKPEIMKYLHDNAGEAESTVITVMNYSKELGRTGDKSGAAYASVALASAKEILDRVHGKATQRTEVTSKKVSVHIDLTGVAGA